MIYTECKKKRKCSSRKVLILRNKATFSTTSLAPSKFNIIPIITAHRYPPGERAVKSEAENATGGCSLISRNRRLQRAWMILCVEAMFIPRLKASRKGEEASTFDIKILDICTSVCAVLWLPLCSVCSSKFNRDDNITTGIFFLAKYCSVMCNIHFEIIHLMHS